MQSTCHIKFSSGMIPHNLYHTTCLLRGTSTDMQTNAEALRASTEFQRESVSGTQNVYPLFHLRQNANDRQCAAAIQFATRGGPSRHPFMNCLARVSAPPRARICWGRSTGTHANSLSEQGRPVCPALYVVTVNRPCIGFVLNAKQWATATLCARNDDSGL